MEKEKLTTKAYWEKYYDRDFDKDNIIDLVSNFDSYWETLMSNSPKSIIEIGGYPGRYLACLSERYTLTPTCLDFNSDDVAIKKTMSLFGIENFTIINTDFTKFKPTNKYDVVFSIGFIEHFDDFNTILDKHVEFLKPNGKILIMIPNKKYLRRLYGYLCDVKNLKAHNLKSMRFNVFKEFSKRNNLEIEKLEYYGGFPYRVHQSLNFFQKLVYHPFRFVFKRLNPFIVKHPNKYLSSTIICVCKLKS